MRIALLIGNLVVMWTTLAPAAAGQSLWEQCCAQSPGISMQPVYTGEVFSNTRGGLSADGAVRYQALVDLPLAVDFQQFDLPFDGRFFVLAQNTHGGGLTEDFVGDTQVLSNIDSFTNIKAKDIGKTNKRILKKKPPHKSQRNLMLNSNTFTFDKPQISVTIKRNPKPSPTQKPPLKLPELKLGPPFKVAHFPLSQTTSLDKNKRSIV